MGRYLVCAAVLCTVILSVYSDNTALPLDLPKVLNISSHPTNSSTSKQHKTRAIVEGVKDLKVSVMKHGDSTEQVVDNQQGQVVKQTVAPDGIHQTVFRNGQVVTDNVVPVLSPSP